MIEIRFAPIFYTIQQLKISNAFVYKENDDSVVKSVGVEPNCTFIAYFGAYKNH